MQKGHYKLQHKMLGTEYLLIANGATFNLLTPSGKFIKQYTDEAIILQHCNVLSKIKAAINLYDIQYWVNGSVVETIHMNATWAVCAWKVDQLKKGNYRNGLLKIKLK